MIVDITTCDLFDTLSVFYMLAIHLKIVYFYLKICIFTEIHRWTNYIYSVHFYKKKVNLCLCSCALYLKIVMTTEFKYFTVKPRDNLQVHVRLYGLIFQKYWLPHNSLKFHIYWSDMIKNQKWKHKQFFSGEFKCIRMPDEFTYKAWKII